MAKALLFVGVFIIFMIFKMIAAGAKTAKDAYTAVNNGESFTSFTQGLQEGTHHAIIGMMTKISKSDGVISQKEAEYIQGLIDQMEDVASGRMHSVESVNNYRQSLIKTFKNAKDNESSVVYYAKKIQNKDNVELMMFIITQLIIIGGIDGLNANKKQLIYQISEVLDIDRVYVTKLMTIHSNESSQTYNKQHTTVVDPYEVLGVSKYDSFENIKKAYRALVKKFHPDNIQGQGLDKEFIEFAKKRMGEINAAFEEIKAAKA